jgi:hypothetical protein
VAALTNSDSAISLLLAPRPISRSTRLVDVVGLPAGIVELDGRELVVTLDPVRALAVGRRALPVLLEIAPDLASVPDREEVAWQAGTTTPALRLHLHDPGEAPEPCSPLRA